MSPSPAPARIVRLVDQSSRGFVEATLFRHLGPSDLVAAEGEWRPVRAGLIARQRREGRHGGTEHGHWDWSREEKTEAVEAGRTLVVGIDFEGSCQGLMAVFTTPRPSRSWLPVVGSLLRRPVVYVDYLETAPWNNSGLTRPGGPRFGSVGTQLLMEEVRLGIETGQDGRVGLHALPQAAPFDLHRGMRLRVRSDWRYHGLPYFEYTAREARVELARHERGLGDGRPN